MLRYFTWREGDKKHSITATNSNSSSSSRGSDKGNGNDNHNSKYFCSTTLAMSFSCHFQTLLHIFPIDRTFPPLWKRCWVCTFRCSCCCCCCCYYIIFVSFVATVVVAVAFIGGVVVMLVLKSSCLALWIFMLICFQALSRSFAFVFNTFSFKCVWVVCKSICFRLFYWLKIEYELVPHYYSFSTIILFVPTAFFFVLISL